MNSPIAMIQKYSYLGISPLIEFMEFKETTEEISEEASDTGGDEGLKRFVFLGGPEQNGRDFFLFFSILIKDLSYGIQIEEELFCIELLFANSFDDDDEHGAAIPAAEI